MGNIIADINDMVWGVPALVLDKELASHSSILA